MKIKLNELKQLIREAVEEQMDRTELRLGQAAKLISATNVKNAEEVLKLLASKTEGEISPEQQALINKLKGRTAKDVVKDVLEKLYIDGLDGKPILGYRAITPTKLRDLINTMKSTKAAVGKEETPSEKEEVDEEDLATLGKKYQTKELAGGQSLEDIAAQLGVSVQRAKQIYDKAMERFKIQAASPGGVESGESVRKVALPAAKQFVEKLRDADSVEDFIINVLKLSRITKKDVNVLVNLKLMADEDMEEEAVAKLLKLYLRGSPLKFVQKFTDVVRPSEKAGRPSAIKRYF